MMIVCFIKRLWFYPKAIVFTIYTLTYNAFQSDSPVADCAFEPIIWIVDHFAGWLGRGLVILVSFLISGVVVIFYVYVMPIVLEYESTMFSICHLICGHWLLLNISFHYYKAVSTNPGYPPSGKKAVALRDIQVCTKCIQPKPPRTHHCSVCNKCILKMDHHCPWINNCVGHFNHRYFFMFCVYMCLGTIYVSLTLFPTFFSHFDDFAKNMFKEYFNIGIPRPTTAAEKYFLKRHLEPKITKPEEESLHNIVIFEFMLCSCVAVAVGALAGWHMILITRGETSVEVYINRAKRKKMKKEGKTFFNPFHYGMIRNWKIVLGLGHGRGLWSIIMPSSHPPNGDGVSWPRPEGSELNDASTIGNDKAAFLA
ncbi:palmitoyltransferase ZDHHC16B-like [Dendronephthya gigantea]|uniref:palmitoyltransferase ZDHHC16B-like n=1 Tax=Dendronephthya gigantea TaxID=151771 RepID=UPI0010694787|nr:palmitoyltransferase ZDHHC16B-like [Dendronephthya gigantea]